MSLKIVQNDFLKKISLKNTRLYLMKHLILVEEANQYAKLSEFNKAISSYEEAISIQPGYVEAYYNLGNLYHQMGELDKAVRNFKKVVALDPDYSKVHPNKTLLVIYFFSKGEINNALETLQTWIKSNPDDALLFNMMGGCYLSLRELKMSIQSYEKALELKPDYAIPQHMINSLKGHTSKSPPKEYVKNLFDDYAERFNDSLVQGLQYKLPFVIKDLIQNISSKSKFAKTIDLGCGTGLSGSGLSEISGHLSGIDISENMISKADELDVYDNLYTGDIVEALNAVQENFDLFVALDVLIYVGDVESIFKTVHKYSNPESIFVFSTEIQEESGYSLLSSSRYSHSDSYIMNQASGKFVLIKSKDTVIRKEGNNLIHGKIYFFKPV
jgi:predicted TPR repeat methyltransferase